MASTKYSKRSFFFCVMNIHQRILPFYRVAHPDDVASLHYPIVITYTLSVDTLKSRVRLTFIFVHCATVSLASCSLRNPITFSYSIYGRLQLSTHTIVSQFLYISPNLGKFLPPLFIVNKDVFNSTQLIVT